MMPNVTGDQLDYAKTQIEKQGIDEKDIQVVGGGTFGVVIESNWIVCSQSPQASQSLENAKVTLTVSRSCTGSGVPLN